MKRLSFLVVLVILTGLVGFTGAQPVRAQATTGCGFIPITQNYTHLYGFLFIDGVEASIGTIVEFGAMRSGEFVRAGCTETWNPGTYGAVRVFGEDVAYGLPGMYRNEPIVIRVDGQIAYYTPVLNFDDDLDLHQRDLQISTSITETTAFMRTSATLTVRVVDAFGRPMTGSYDLSIYDPMGRKSTGHITVPYGEEVVYGLNPTGIFLIRLEIDPAQVLSKTVSQPNERELIVTYTLTMPTAVKVSTFKASSGTIWDWLSNLWDWLSQQLLR